MYPQNDLVVQTARDASKDFDYNDALYDMLGDISTATTLPDRLGAFKSSFPGLTQDQIPYIYSPFFAPLKTSLVLKRGSGSPTFTRATTKGIFDHEGILRTLKVGEIGFTGARRIENRLTFTEDFNNAAWVISTFGTGTASKTPNYGIAPDGTQTACRVQATIGNGYGGLFWVPSGTANNPHTSNISCWIKSNTGTSQTISFNDYSDPTNRFIVVTPTWQRFSQARTITSINNPGIQLAAYTGSDATIDVQIWHPQVELNQSIVGEYVSVGVLSAPFHGSMVDGVKCFAYQNGNTVASNVVTEGQGAAIADATLQGYLSESAATQLTLDPRDMTTANWVLGATLTRNRNQIGADGAANTATLLTGGAVTATNTILQTLVAAASSRTYGVLLKRGTGTGPVQLMQGGTLSDISGQLNTNTFTLVQLNANILNVAYGIRVDTNGDTVIADFNQFEAGAFTTSPMSGGTRNADVLTYPISGNISNTAGTIYFEGMTNWTNNSFGIGAFAVGTDQPGGMYISNGLTSTRMLLSDAIVSADKTGLTDMSSAIRKRAGTWGSGGLTVTGDGLVVATNTYDGSIFTAGSLGIGCDGSGIRQWGGNVRNVRIWGVQLPDAILQGLTT